MCTVRSSSLQCLLDIFSTDEHPCTWKLCVHLVLLSCETMAKARDPSSSQQPHTYEPPPVSRFSRWAVNNSLPFIISKSRPSLSSQGVSMTSFFPAMSARQAEICPDGSPPDGRGTQMMSTGCLEFFLQVSAVGQHVYRQFVPT